MEKVILWDQHDYTLKERDRISIEEKIKETRISSMKKLLNIMDKLNSNKGEVLRVDFLLRDKITKNHLIGKIGIPTLSTDGYINSNFAFEISYDLTTGGKKKGLLDELEREHIKEVRGGFRLRLIDLVLGVYKKGEHQEYPIFDATIGGNKEIYQRLELLYARKG